jgi:hypothetical protein
MLMPRGTSGGRWLEFVYFLYLVIRSIKRVEFF